MTGIPALSGAASVQAGVAVDTSRLATRANLEAAGDRFEAIFVNMMVKSMRTAKLADGLFDSQAQQQFRDMQDQKLAENMASHAPIGIGKAMTEFLARSQAIDDPAGATAPAARPGRDA